MESSDWLPNNNPRLPGYTLNFDGVDEYVVSDRNLGITGATPRTVLAWVNATSVLTGSKYIYSWGAETTLNAFTTTFGTSGTGDVYIFLSGRDWCTCTNTVLPNTWYRVVVTYNGGLVETTGSVKLYLNGERITLTSIGSNTGVLNTTDGVLKIGASIGTAAFFPGSIADVTIYNRDFTLANILSDYQRSLAWLRLRDGQVGKAVAAAVGRRIIIISELKPKALQRFDLIKVLR